MNKPIKILAYNSKGGVGKTTTVWALGSALARAKQQTLIVDLDFQGHQARGFGIKKGNNLVRMLTKQCSAEEALVNVRENLDLIPSDFELSNFWNNLPDNIIAETLKPIENKYKFILFDSNPGMNDLTKSAAIYVDYVISPVNLEYFSIDGTVTLERLMRSIDKEFKKKLLGIIPCKHDLRGRRTTEILNIIKKRYKNKISPPVRVNNEIDKAQNMGSTIFEHDSYCNGALDYLEVTKWVVQSVQETVK